MDLDRRDDRIIQSFMLALDGKALRASVKLDTEQQGWQIESSRNDSPSCQRFCLPTTFKAIGCISTGLVVEALSRYTGYWIGGYSYRAESSMPNDLHVRWHLPVLWR